MCRLLPVNIYIAIGKDRTTYRTNTYRLFFHAHFRNYFCHQFMDNAMRAAWAVVHCYVVHQLRLLSDHILWLQYFFSCHDSFLFNGSGGDFLHHSNFVSLKDNVKRLLPFLLKQLKFQRHSSRQGKCEFLKSEYQP